MRVLGIDIGSSSVKAGVLANPKLQGRVVREQFPTDYDGVRAQVDGEQILRAVGRAIRAIGSEARRVDAIAISNMAPSWTAMDKRGRAITPVVTHQDRRSVDVARELEKRIGKSRHLRLVGNRPFPGGISSTTFAWFNQNARGVMRRADLVGHLNTYLHRQLTAARVIDPSNASFMGLYRLDLGGWCQEVCDAVGASEHQLPQVIGADGVGGLITREAGRRFGLTHGTPVLAGLIDTGAGMLLAGAKPGRLLNVCGSTDVLALCIDKPRPHETLITRALGVGGKYLAVSTLAAGGSTIQWLRERLFIDLKEQRFHALVRKLAARPAESSVLFEPYLAGDRMSIEQRTATFRGLTLSTTREQMLSAAIESLARASAARVKLLQTLGTRIDHHVTLSGGVSRGLGAVLHRDWPGKWTFKFEAEATLRGLSRLI
jgi:xylulokinase